MKKTVLAMVIFLHIIALVIIILSNFDYTTTLMTSLFVLTTAMILISGYSKMKHDPVEHYKSKNPPRWGVSLPPPKEPESSLDKVVVTREMVKVRCPHCKNTYDETLVKCPHCGGHP